MTPRVLGFALLAGLVSAGAALADATDDRYAACLSKVKTDAEAAMEDALVWSSQGGLHRAEHCLALAHIAMGKHRLGALRLEELAGQTERRPPEMRAELWVQAGDAWFLDRAWNEAARVFTYAIHARPGLTDAYRGRARVALEQDRPEDALQDLAIAARLNDRERYTYELMARAEIIRQDFSAALDAVEKALALEPDHLETLVLRGEIRQRAEGLMPVR